MADDKRKDGMPEGAGDTQRSALLQNELTTSASLPPAMVHRDSHSPQTKADK